MPPSVTDAWESPFFGRSTELALVVSALQRGERLVSILGPPGMGKTRLARQAVASLRASGVACAQIDAAACRDVEQIRAQLIMSLGGLADPPDPGARGGVARTLAMAGAAVVLVDNLEAMVEAAAAELQSWLVITSELSLLVTSRVRLRVPPELVIDLGPIEEEAGVALFEDRARRAVSGFALRAGERASVCELVRRLDCLPLAIELAAARSRVFRPADLLRRSNTPLELVGPPTRGESLGPLATAIQTSFEALTPEGQRALEYISVLGIPHDMEAIEAMIGKSRRAAAEIVEELVDASLLRSSVDEDRDALCFTLYESIRDFAASRLDGSGERATAERTLSDHLLVLGERLTVASTGPDAVDGLERLARVREEMRRACDREIGQRPDVAATLALVLHVLALARGPLDQQHALLERVNAALGEPAHATLRARVDAALGYVCFLRGRMEKAGEHLARAYSLATEAGLHDVAAEARSTLLLATQWRGQNDAGDSDAVPARDLSAFSLFTLGLRALHHGDIDSAGELLLRARETGLLVGHHRDAGRALGLYGLTRHEIGKLDAAGALFDQAAVELQRAGDDHFHAVIVLWRGLLTLERGDVEAAVAELTEAAKAFERVGDPFFEAAAHGYSGLAWLFAHQPVQARDCIALALPVLRNADDTYRLGVFLPLYAVACLDLGDEPSARKAFEEARAVAQRVANPNVNVVIDVLQALGDPRIPDPRSTGASELALRLSSSTDVRFALALFDRARGEVSAAAPSPSRLAVAEDGTSFRVDGRLVDLRRRQPLSRLLARLAAEHEQSPGTPLATAALVAAGWPGERMLPASGANRVHVAIATLRRLGLGHRLGRAEGGYLIPPEIVVSRAET